MRAEHRTGVDTPVSKLYGVGAKRAEAFAGLGIRTVLDLVYHFPRGYENRGNVKVLSETEDGEVCSVIMTVSSPAKNAMIKRGMTITRARCFDDTGSCDITFFNQPFMKDVLVIGSEFRFFGKIKLGKTRREMTNPAMETYRDGAVLRPFVPVYPLVKGISQRLMGKAVSEALDICFSPVSDGETIKEHLPLRIREEYGLADIRYSLYGIHRPDDRNMMEKAGRRLAFDEIYMFALRLSSAGKKAKSRTDAVFAPPDRSAFMNKIPFSLTPAQLRSVDELEADMAGGFRMNRMLTGDVGSGKTVCAEYAVFDAVSNGYQAAVMAPTEILARQHYADMEPLFRGLGYKTGLLIGATPAAAKRKICSELASGEMNVVIGTHALLEDTVIFNKLGLCVVDEQHRFGALQRDRLVKKSASCHMLSMSATPIPRSLALILYGEYDLSTIDTMPPGRQKTGTFVVGEELRERMNGFIRKTVDEGGQVYIVCPAVEEAAEAETVESESGEKFSLSELVSFGRAETEVPLKSAVALAAELSEKIFPDIKIGFIHGRLKSTEKDRIMNEFVSGEIKILVSTTVIEVGVNVPNASLMIVENAERFGLSQLHQLRGRVGRGVRKSYCILVSDSGSERAKNRLEILRTNSSGYKIAEYDLKMRGPGDFIAQSGKKLRQSGDSDFRLLSAADTGLLYKAMEAAKKTLTDDPYLTLPENEECKKRLGAESSRSVGM